MKIQLNFSVDEHIDAETDKPIQYVPWGKYVPAITFPVSDDKHVLLFRHKPS